ncbi:hypothetical protein MRX96_038858 [Rhipicephalus microplus]
MSSRDRSRERSPPEHVSTPKKTKEGGSDEDAPKTPAEKSTVPPTPEKAGGSAPRGATSTRTPTKKAHASPRSLSKSQKKSSLAKLGYRVRSLFGMGGSSTSSPSKHGESSSSRSSQSGSSKGRKPFIGPQLPEGYIPYSRSELERIAEYYRQTSFLNRGVGITEYIPWGPGAEATIPWTTPPPMSAPTYSKAPSGSASLASQSKAVTTTPAAPGPLMSPPTLPYSQALGPDANYPELSSLAKAYSRADKSTKQLFPNLTAVAASQAKAVSPKKEIPELPMLSAIAMVMASIGPPGSSAGAVKSQPPKPGSEFIQPDGQEPSCSGLQRTEFHDDTSTSTSDYSPDVPPRYLQPPFRPPKPPSPTGETEEERLKRARRKGDPRW